MDREQEQIIRTEYSELMQKSYIDYAMSVIVSRALPDVRDGLKPVQRRTLYDMYELGIRYDRPYRKCARIVGDTMGIADTVKNLTIKLILAVDGKCFLFSGCSASKKRAGSGKTDCETVLIFSGDRFGKIQIPSGQISHCSDQRFRRDNISAGIGISTETSIASYINRCRNNFGFCAGFFLVFRFLDRQADRTGYGL